MRHSRLRALPYVVVAALAAACTTTSPKPTPDPGLSQGKAGSKNDQPPAATQAPPPAVAAVPPVPAAKPAPTPAELMNFVRTQVSPTATFGAKEHELVASLANGPATGTVEEAALALGLVKGILFPMNINAPTFQESDIGSSDTGRAKSKLLSLEALTKERDVNLADALTENPLLASHSVARQVVEALGRGANSADYRAEILVAVRNRAAQWSELAQELGGAATATAATPAPVADADAPPPNPADLRGGDSVLGEAQSLADRGQYQAAIKKAATVESGNPLYAAAQEKIRDFSNRAVQDLRRKAAAAFQNALPLTDGKARAEYLRQAKGFLEEAINSFPQATQLPTVRDNLRVISRDLEKLESEGKPAPKAGE